MKDVLYFSDLNIDDIDFEETGRKPTLGVLFKRVSENLPNVIDDVVRQMVYGNSRFHPGDDDSPCRKLLKVDEKGKEKDLLGIWAPDNALTKATALKLLFPNVSKPFRIPEETPIPLHIAVAYDAFKVPEFQDLSSKYPGEVMRFGFFSSDVVNDAQLIAKTVEDFENRKEPPTYEEKIVLQLSKSNKECVEAFMELGPSYRSLDVEKGEQDCKFFFPADYDAPPQKLIEKSKKSKKKRTKMTQQITINEDGQEIIETSIDITTVNQEENNDTGEVEGEEKEDEEEDDEDAAPADFDGNDETVVGADKATSPIDNASKVGEQEKH